MGKRINGKGNLYLYLRWPIILSIYLLVVTMIIYAINPNVGIVLLGFLVLYIAFVVYLFLFKFNNLESAIRTVAMNEAKNHGFHFSKIDIPYAVLSIEGRILWGNDAFLSIAKNLQVGNGIDETFVELSKNLFKTLKEDKIQLLTSYNEKKYKVHIRKVDLNEIEKDAKVKVYNKNETIVLLYLNDETELYTLKQENENNKQVTGFIYIDNYEEVTENMEDSKASMLIAMVDRRLTRYISYNSGIIKKLEKDKYFFVTTKKDIEDMIEDRFSILEQTKEIIGGDNIPLTLSIGIGYEGKNIEANHELARVAMDMALGRGGDQAVVKRGTETLFFGGKSASSTSNVRVRARVKSASFRETLDTKDKVLIVGHKKGDFDSFGASIGVYIMAKHLGKDTHIVINSLTKATEEMKTKFIENNAYPKDMFMSGSDAIAFADENTLLIVVDHNIKAIDDEEALCGMGLDTVIFDHHRVQTNSITDSVLTYIDPSASSTSELVCEIITYFDEKLKIAKLEADTMLGGIIVDTAYFTYQTGPKTFEMASYLKKKGADFERLRKILRYDIESVKLKNEVISSAEFYKDSYAIACIPVTEGIETNVMKAEIANELIDIKGVKASIVISFEEGQYSISSRSIDELNVQVLMEKLGGGGHRSVAGATVEATKFEDVVFKVKEAIDKIIEEEEKE